jgi:hypothetical protein
MLSNPASPFSHRREPVLRTVPTTEAVTTPSPTVTPISPRQGTSNPDSCREYLATIVSTGKTHLAIGLAIRTCQAGRLQARAPRLGRYRLLVSITSRCDGGQVRMSI